MDIVTAPVPPTLHSPCRHYFTCNSLSILRCSRHSIFSYADVDTNLLVVQPFHASLRCIPSALGTLPSATHSASLLSDRSACVRLWDSGACPFLLLAFPHSLPPSFSFLSLYITSVYAPRLPRLRHCMAVHTAPAVLVPLHLTPARSTTCITPYPTFATPRLRFTPLTVINSVLYPQLSQLVGCLPDVLSLPSSLPSPSVR
jgi:hypothetical protein